MRISQLVGILEDLRSTYGEIEVSLQSPTEIVIRDTDGAVVKPAPGVAEYVTFDTWFVVPELYDLPDDPLGIEADEWRVNLRPWPY